MGKSKNAKRRAQLAHQYNNKASAPEANASVQVQSTVLAAIAFSLATCEETAQAQTGLTAKTLKKYLQGFPIPRSQEDILLAGAVNMGWDPNAAPA